MSLVLGPATRADAPAIARLHRSALRAAMPWLPELHTPAQDLAFFRDRVLETCRVVVAGIGEGADEPCGFIGFRPGWIDHLYVHPDHQGRGFGTALTGTAQAAFPELRLWVFQRNLAARRFYAARGFVLERETDGSLNEEKEPDVVMRWRRER